MGDGSNPLIKENEILDNKKCGIKLLDYARADIVDHNVIQNNLS